MTERVVIGDCELYCGDCRDILPFIGKVNCIVSDPPYLLTSGGKTGGMKGGCLDPANYENNGKLVQCDLTFDDFMPLCAFVLEKGDAYFMANNRNVRDLLNAAARPQDPANDKSPPLFEFHNLLVWDKITATANRWYMKNCEFTGYFYRGKSNVNGINDCSCKQLIRCPQIDESDHPTEKPVALMAHYINNSTQPGEIVLDPFMGSGTTGVAAAKNNRRFIGIEIDRKFFDISCARIERAYKDTATLL